MSEKALAEFTATYKSLVIVPSTSVDALLASSILFKKLVDHGLDVKVSINTRLIVDYPDDPAILIDLPPVNNKKQLSITLSDAESTLTGTIVSMLDKLVGVDNVDKLLSVIAGLYKGLYDFKEGGFKGIEGEFIKGLVNEKILVEIPGLRAWGVKRVGLATALYRTLMPYIPGITGNYEKASKIVMEIFKVRDPSTVKQKEIKTSEPRDAMLLLLRSISEITRDSSLAYRLLGDYILIQPHLGDLGEIELHELMGAITVYVSYCYRCPLDLALSTIDKSIFTQILVIYNSVIDKLVPGIVPAIEGIKKGGIPELPNIIKRPDLIVDILSYNNSIPKNKPVVVQSDIGAITVLRELLRTGVKPEEAYHKCREDQICQQESRQ